MTCIYAVRAPSLVRRAALVLFALACAAPVSAQNTVTVSAEQENLRAEQRGQVVAVLERGTPLQLVRADGQWREVTLRGWIWGASVEPTGRASRLSVSAVDGENLRASPNGQVLARVNRGTVLTELQRQGAWARVERTAWIWGASVSGGSEAASATTTATPPAQTPAQTQPAAPRGAAAGRTPTDSVLAANWLRAGSTGSYLLGAPDGDTLGRLRPMTAMEVVAREGNWARVRVEAWVWEPSSTSAADSGSVLRNISASTVAGSPDSFRGRIVEWNVQFIALERAERIRTDFYEGEPFMLARAPGDEASFVYIAVPPERVAQVERLSPLQRVTVLGRIRTGRSRVMGAPVLDLLELRSGS